MASRITNFLVEKNFFSSKQHGFREKEGVTELLTFLTDFWTEKTYPGSKFHIVNSVFLDISKAFDTVQHDSLLYKILRAGIGGDCSFWIRDFLENRTQKVALENVESCSQPINAGVIQGSCLGPLLFLIFINDLEENIESDINFFADDTHLFVAGMPEQDQVRILNKDLKKIEFWSNRWKINFAPEKTIHLRFSRKRKNAEICNESIYFKDVPVKTAETHRILGVYFDTKLNFKEQHKKLLTKVTKNAGILRKYFAKRPDLTRHSRDVLAKSFLFSISDWASEVWEKDNSKSLSELDQNLRKFAKNVVGSRKNSNQDNLDVEIGWLLPKTRRKIRKAESFLRITSLRDDHCLKLYRDQCLSNPVKMKRTSFLKSAKKILDSSNIENLLCPLSRKDQKTVLKGYFRLEESIEWTQNALKQQSTRTELWKIKSYKDEWKHASLENFKDSQNLAQLRIGWDFLNRTGFRLKKIASPDCTFCGVLEDRNHFLLDCKRFAQQRAKLKEIVKNVGATFTVKTLLGGEKLSKEKQKTIAKATAEFIRETKRHKEGYYDHQIDPVG